MTTVYIVNPVAGRGLTRDLWPKLQAGVAGGGEVRYTERPGHATELAQDAVRQGADLVVAVGGDGTATEVALGLRGTQAVMGHVPTGAGCDLRTSLGLPKRPEEALKALGSGSLTIQTIDVGLSGNRGFLTVSGVGFDAEVAAEDARARTTGLRGSLPYLKAIMKVLVSYRPTPIRLIIDEQEALEGRALLVAVANCQYYGGGMRIAPYASPTDGLLDVVVAGDFSVPGTLGILPKVFSGKHRTHPKVAFFTGSRVRIESDPPLASHLNGDPAGLTPIEFSVDPGALRVLAGDIPGPMAS